LVVTLMTAEKAWARAAHYRAIAERNVDKSAYDGLLTLAMTYEAYVARLDKEAQGKVIPIRPCRRSEP
jgi:hypothetical protein